jgi:hypothetical protein
METIAATTNRTTLVLPGELYEELRKEAFEKRMSLGAVIRMRLEYRPKPTAEQRPTAAAAQTDPLLAIAGLADSGALTAGLAESLTENLDEDLYEL